jgi:Flp pilus assembly protein TadG
MAYIPESEIVVVVVVVVVVVAVAAVAAVAAAAAAAGAAGAEVNNKTRIKTIADYQWTQILWNFSTSSKELYGCNLYV